MPRDVVEEVRQAAPPAKADAALAHLERAVDLVARGDSRPAIREAEQAKALAGRSGAVREVLGLAYYGAERWKEALREMQTYRRLTGRRDQNHIIADCHRALGNTDRAVEEAGAALSSRISEETRAEAAIVGASALADRGRHRDALAFLRRFASRGDGVRPHDLRVWYVEADILSRSGKQEEAAEVFRRIMRHDAAAFDVAERLAAMG